jgi:NADH-quinone oxidoreductase subunit A
MIEYGGILFFALFALMLVLVFLGLTSVLGPKRPNPVKDQPFECGLEPQIKKKGVSTHFYLFGMLFIIFDVELAFLFPWAVLAKKLGFFGLIEIGIFLLFILMGYLFALRRGALEPQ